MISPETSPWTPPPFLRIDSHARLLQAWLEALPPACKIFPATVSDACLRTLPSETPTAVVPWQLLSQEAKVDADNLTLDASTACTLASLESVANQAGLTLGGVWPQAPAWQNELTLAEVLLRQYQPLQTGGSTLPLRAKVLGLEYLLPCGTVACVGGRVVKNVTGYDLHKLQLGNAGSLTLPTAAILKLSPRPQARQWLYQSGMRKADVQTLQVALQQRPYAALQAAIAIQTEAQQDETWQVWIELAGLPSLIACAAQALQASTAQPWQTWEAEGTSPIASTPAPLAWPALNTVLWQVAHSGSEGAEGLGLPPAFSSTPVTLHRWWNLRSNQHVTTALWGQGEPDADALRLSTQAWPPSICSPSVWPTGSVLLHHACLTPEAFCHNLPTDAVHRQALTQLKTAWDASNRFYSIYFPLHLL